MVPYLKKGEHQDSWVKLTETKAVGVRLLYSNISQACHALLSAELDAEARARCHFNEMPNFLDHCGLQMQTYHFHSLQVSVMPAVSHDLKIVNRKFREHTVLKVVSYMPSWLAGRALAPFHLVSPGM